MPKDDTVHRTNPKCDTICTHTVISYHTLGSSSRIFRRLFYYGFNFMSRMRTLYFRQGFVLPFLRISNKYLNNHSCSINLKTNSKKRRKLPNGSGSIKHLSGKRSKPWAAYPPVKEFTLTGSPILNIAIGYFKTYDQAYQALMLYNSTSSGVKQSSISLSDLYATMLSNHNGAVSPQYLNITFAELYDQFFESKYEKSKKKLSNASRNSTKAAFNNCKKLHDRKFADLRKADLQGHC